MPDPWTPASPRRGADGLQPGQRMRIHDAWWHTIFEMPNGWQVVLDPFGIALGTYPTEADAKARAQENARVRALNMLDSARSDIRDASAVLANLSVHGIGHAQD